MEVKHGTPIEASIYDEGVLSMGFMSRWSLCPDGVMYGGVCPEGICPGFIKSTCRSGSLIPLLKGTHNLKKTPFP